MTLFLLQEVYELSQMILNRKLNGLVWGCGPFISWEEVRTENCKVERGVIIVPDFYLYHENRIWMNVS